jgi:hypothetical protein
VPPVAIICGKDELCDTLAEHLASDVERVCVDTPFEAVLGLDILARQGRLADVLFASAAMPHDMLGWLLRQVRNKDILNYCRIVVVGLGSPEEASRWYKLGANSCLGANPEHLQFAAAYWGGAGACQPVEL